MYTQINKMDYNTLWNKITHVFNILKDEYEDNNCTENEYNEVLSIIIQLKFVNNIENLIFNKLAKHLRQNVVPKFWAYFSKTDSCHFTLFQKAIHDLYFDLSVHIPLITKLDKLHRDCKSTSLIFGLNDSLSAFKLLVRSTLLSQLPPDYTKTVVSFYEDAFRAFCNLDEESSDEDNNCTGCLQEMPMCRCQEICCIFYDTNRRLVDLDLLEPLVGQVLTSLIHVRIENHILQVSKNSYDTHYVESLEKWLNTVVITWLKRIYCIDSVANHNISENMDKFKQKLTYFMIETYTKTRINQLFNIIIEYPESQAAVEDLHACLPKTNLRPYLITTLQNSLQTRLLHPGVSTPDILTAYVAVIRSIRVLDPSGVLLDIVTQPLHAYLRGRDDTVRCVVGSLSEEGPNDLADELVRAEALHLDDHDNEEEDCTNWETWNPDPVHVDKTKRRNKRTSDIISMLVNVYGSKELFVNEYRTLLADRLLTQFLDSTEKEIRYLELLKLRFGETQLHYCEVMLKDISHSKRINTHLQNDEEYIQLSQNFPMSALILSAQFWPVFKDETLELPELIKEQLKYYTTAFETLKGNRTLCWKPHLGTVELDIELKDRTLNLSVSPLHATIIMHFQDKEQWTVDELSQAMKVPATLLRKKISFWQSQGVLQEISTDVFLLIEDSESSKEKVQNSDIVLEDDESESAMASSQDQREEELQVFWSYIIGMLTNLDCMPLERIHQMLKMFASQGPTAIECSLQELRHFLDRKVREHKLTCQGGFYRLPKT